MKTITLVVVLLVLPYVTNAQSGCQKSYTDMAIYGNDLTKTLGPSSSCCQACQQQSGCQAYTWDKTNEGTCWLKSDTQPLYLSNGSFTVMMAPDSSGTYHLNMSYDASNWLFDEVFYFKTGEGFDCGCFVNFTDKLTAEKKRFGEDCK